jgi:hypothetical protein
MYKTGLLFLSVVSVCLGCRVVEGALVVNANVSNDMTWTAADNPVQVTKGDFQVTTGAVLTIRPGVVVEVASQFRVMGTLRALGEATNRITFTGASPGAGWGGLNFSRYLPADAAVTNYLSYCDISNLTTEIWVDRQAARFENCRIDIRFSSSSAGFRGYVNTNTYPHARIDLVSNEITIVCKRNTGFGTASGMILDGCPAYFMGNVFHLEVTNSLQAFYGIQLYRSNTDTFEANMLNNVIDVVCTSTQHIQDIYGVYYDPYASGWISNCSISVAAPRNARGLSTRSWNRVQGVDILVTNTESGGYGYLYGTYIESTSAQDNDLLLDSRVRVYGTGENRGIYGIYFQDGGVRGNRVYCQLNSSNSFAYGITRIYYQGNTDANSVHIVAPPDSVGLGLNLSTHYNPSAVLRARDNIFFMEGGGSGQGVRVEDSFSSIFENSYNLVCGFSTLFSNCVAGVGTVTNHPGWNDGAFHLGATSPAVDVALQLPWMTNSVDFEGDPRIDGPAPDLGADEWFQQPMAQSAWTTNAWGGMQLRCVTGGVYRLEGAIDLTAPAWSELSPSITAQTGFISFNWPLSESLEFMRVVRRRP